MELSDAPILKFDHLKIDQKDQEKFEKASIENLTTSIAAEDDSLLMLSGHEAGDSKNNYILECYKNEAGLKKHENSEQFKRYSDVTGSVVTESDNFDLVPELILTKEDKLQVNANDQYVVQLGKFTLVDEDLDKFGNALRNEVEQLVINEEGFVGAVAGKFFDIENEWRVFMIFKTRESYERHLKGKWHDKFVKDTREMIYDRDSESLSIDSLVDQGEIIYRG